MFESVSASYLWSPDRRSSWDYPKQVTHSSVLLTLPGSAIERCFQVMGEVPRHTYLLAADPEPVASYYWSTLPKDRLTNVWPGAVIRHQEDVDAAAPLLGVPTPPQVGVWLYTESTEPLDLTALLRPRCVGCGTPYMPDGAPCQHCELASRVMKQCGVGHGPTRESTSRLRLILQHRLAHSVQDQVRKANRAYGSEVELIEVEPRGRKLIWLGALK